ncbi:hypothetical protein DN402_06210 [Streptomyces sp. SW4]|nr:hypothetical protein DN402_06210 [Streptomyces sp. SW4]
MIRIAQEIERITGAALPVDALISRPTVAALTAAALPDAAAGGTAAGAAAAGPPGPSPPPGPPPSPRDLRRRGAEPGTRVLTAEDVARTAASVLNLPGVDPDADLFDLGATSFSMIRLAQEIESATGRQVPVDVLIQSPTARAVAESLALAPAPAAAAPGRPAATPPASAGTDVRIALDPAAKAAFKEARIAERRLPASLPRLPVPAAGPAETLALFDASSFRDFAGEPVPARDLLDLLATVTWGDLDGRAKRRYPSGGGFYPVQVYVYLAPGAVAGTDPGLYYLHPAERALIALAPTPATAPTCTSSTTVPSWRGPPSVSSSSPPRRPSPRPTASGTPPASPPSRPATSPSCCSPAHPSGDWGCARSARWTSTPYAPTSASTTTRSCCCRCGAARSPRTPGPAGRRCGPARQPGRTPVPEPTSAPATTRVASPSPSSGSPPNCPAHAPCTTSTPCWPAAAPPPDPCPRTGGRRCAPVPGAPEPASAATSTTSWPPRPRSSASTRPRARPSTRRNGCCCPSPAAASRTPPSSRHDSPSRGRSGCSSGPCGTTTRSTGSPHGRADGPTRARTPPAAASPTAPRTRSG